MAAPKGNKFWEMRSSHGRNPIFHDAAELWDAACEYFQWVEDNHIEDEQLFAYQGVVTVHQAKKVRPMTIQGLCLFLDISRQGWSEYKAKEDFSDIVERIETTIYDQKFAGATVGIFNANIIARELGLADKADHTSSDGSHGRAISIGADTKPETIEALATALGLPDDGYIK